MSLDFDKAFLVLVRDHVKNILLIRLIVNTGTQLLMIKYPSTATDSNCKEPTFFSCGAYSVLDTEQSTITPFRRAQFSDIHYPVPVPVAKSTKLCEPNLHRKL
jgi:hypothetical protein